MVLSMERWIGKVVVVTGASSGIGAGIAKRLVEEGLVVVGLARRIDRMEEAARELSGKRGSFHPIKCDVGSEEDILEAFSYIRTNLGPVHVMINNAGIARIAPLRDGETSKWKEVLDVNMIGLSVCTREAIKDMEEHDIEGQIIHVSSVTGQRIPENFPLNMYAPSKAAVTALADVLRFEFNAVKSKIKITCLTPGIVLTEIFDATGLSFDFLRDEVGGGEMPYITVDDIADSVVYILSTPPNVMVSDLTVRPILGKL